MLGVSAVCSFVPVRRPLTRRTSILTCICLLIASEPDDPSQQPALTLLPSGCLGLGILALVYGDFALCGSPSPHGSQAGRFSPMVRAWLCY